MNDLDRHLHALRESTDEVPATHELKGRLLDIAIQGGPEAPSPPLALRREVLSLPNRLGWWWSHSPWGRRAVAAAAMFAVAIPSLFGVRQLRAQWQAQALAADDLNVESQLFPITSAPSQDCWGLGAGVTHRTPDKAQFTFDFPVTAKKAIATLSFTSGGVADSEEVDISNGPHHLGWVNRSFGDDQQAQEVRLTTKYLKPNLGNLLLFQNIRNPPGREPWVICNVAVRVEQLPDGTPTELQGQAGDLIATGDRFYQDRLIDAGNLFAAWMSYRKADLFLEALDNPGDEYAVIQQKIRDCRRELDEECSKLELKGHAFEKQGKIADALSTYKYGLRFFPSADHACYAALRNRIANLE